MKTKIFKILFLTYLFVVSGCVIFGPTCKEAINDQQKVEIDAHWACVNENAKLVLGMSADQLIKCLEKNDMLGECSIVKTSFNDFGETIKEDTISPSDLRPISKSDNYIYQYEWVVWFKPKLHEASMEAYSKLQEFYLRSGAEYSDAKSPRKNIKNLFPSISEPVLLGIFQKGNKFSVAPFFPGSDFFVLKGYCLKKWVAVDIYLHEADDSGTLVFRTEPFVLVRDSELHGQRFDYIFNISVN